MCSHRNPVEERRERGKEGGRVRRDGGRNGGRGGREKGRREEVMGGRKREGGKGEEGGIEDTL